MNDILLTILISLVTSLLGAIVVDIYTRVKRSSKKAIDKHKQEQIDEMRGLIKDTMKDSLVGVSKEVNDIKHDVSEIYTKDIPQLREANICSLRDQLTNMFVRCKIQKFRTLQDTENATHMFASYRTLGGNSYVPELMEEFMALPQMTAEEMAKRLKNTAGNNGNK